MRRPVAGIGGRILFHFNPRTPCGVRHVQDGQGKAGQNISIHAPLAGCDGGKSNVAVGRKHISIHAPLAGCDFQQQPFQIAKSRFQSTHPLRGATTSPVSCANWLIYFNPRTPCGVRPLKRVQLFHSCVISIHAPLAGCDQKSSGPSQSRWISIHAPLAGCDCVGLLDPPIVSIFQSTHPLRGATNFGWECFRRNHISIHAPLAGCDSKSAQKNAALLRKRYKYKLFVCKKCTFSDLTGAYSSKNMLYSGANCSENPCALSVRTHRISGPSTSNPGLMPKCSILERYFSPR